MNARSLLIPLLLLVGCVPAGEAGSYYVDTSCNLCIVEGELNGKKTYFLMDTGSGVTILDSNQKKHFGFGSMESDLEIGVLSNNVSRIQHATGITSIRINKMDVTGDDVFTTNMHNLVKHIQHCAQKTISGVIGVPIIKKHGLVIDLTNNKLYRN